MRKFKRVIISALLVVSLMIGFMLSGFAASKKTDVKVGVGKADITGPITKISTGYNSMGDLMQGLLMRLNARAFVVEKGDKTMAYASVEIVHMTESIKPGVIKELHKRGLTKYNENNMMISATHCHSSSSNVSWFPLYSLVNGVPGFDEASYNLIVKGIADAIEKADKDLAPGKVTLYYGNTTIENFNRSLDASRWNVNYKEMYGDLPDLEAVSATVSKEMSVLSFSHKDGGDIGMLSFHASHGTSNGMPNRLIASDHKGYAAYAVEKEMGNGYVAAFAQAESGDASPNEPQVADYKAAFLRPCDIDKNLDPIENEIVDGKQDAKALLQLLKGGKGVTKIDLTNKLAYNYTTKDFSKIKVDKKYIGRYHMPYDNLDNVTTSEPCVGTAIIAGDEEGAPVDNAKEGTVRNNYYIDENGEVKVEKAKLKGVVDMKGFEKIADPLWPLGMKILQSDKYDDLQMEKKVCLAVGGLMQKIQPIQIFQIGETAICSVSFEVNTEQARRIKEFVAPTLAQAGVKHIILSTHTNSYSQYMVTREEFAAQHYEGSTDLFGPWTGAAMSQEMDKLAQDLVSNKLSDPGPGMPMQPTKMVIKTMYSVGLPKIDWYNPGTLKEDVSKKVYKSGDTVSAKFTAADPRHITNLRLNDDPIVPQNYTFMEVQKKVGGKWVTDRNDADPYTYIKYEQKTASKKLIASVNWLLRDAKPGEYRLVYKGIKKVAFKGYQTVEGYSSPFYVR